jgi:hypothetical protein
MHDTDLIVVCLIWDQVGMNLIESKSQCTFNFQREFEKLRNGVGGSTCILMVIDIDFSKYTLIKVSCQFRSFDGDHNILYVRDQNSNFKYFAYLLKK